jgi:hypothetical protein
MLHYFFFLLVFVCFCLMFLYFFQWFTNSFQYQYLFRSPVFNFPVEIISSVLITSKLLYFLILCVYTVSFLAFYSGWINDISNIMGLDPECVTLLLFLLLFCSLLFLLLLLNPFIARVSTEFRNILKQETHFSIISICTSYLRAGIAQLV